MNLFNDAKEAVNLKTSYYIIRKQSKNQKDNYMSVMKK